MKHRVFEITGIGFPNRGAELMLAACCQKLLARYPDDVTLTCAPRGNTLESFRTIVSHQAYPRLQLFFRRFDWGSSVGNAIPTWIRRRFGSIAENEVTVVLDASGLRYSDSFGAGFFRAPLKQYKRVKNRKGKVILLPQAFGPFENKSVCEKMKRLYEYADILFARDQISYQYLSSLLGTTEKIIQSPDFTNLTEGKIPDDRDLFDQRIAIIPNAKMLQHKEINVRSSYINGIVALARLCQKRGHSMFLLNHEGVKDQQICNQIQNTLTAQVPSVGGRPTLEIKGIIGLASGVITSRFHGLASALSQGVPSIATSWSHKYESLLDDYQVENGLLNFADEQSKWLPAAESFLDKLEDPDKRESHRLKDLSQMWKKKSEQMWENVFTVIDSNQ